MIKKAAQILQNIQNLKALQGIYSKIPTTLVIRQPGHTGHPCLPVRPGHPGRPGHPISF